MPACLFRRHHSLHPQGVLREAASLTACTGACSSRRQASSRSNSSARPRRPSRRSIRTSRRSTAARVTDDYFWLREKGDSGGRASPRGGERVHRGGDEADGGRSRRRSTTRCSRASSRPIRRRRIARATTHYFDATEEGKQYPSLLRRRVGGGAPQVMLDVNEMAKGHGFYALGDVQRERRRQPARLHRSIPPAIVSTRCASRICGRARSSRDAMPRVTSVDVGDRTTRRSSSPPKTPSPNARTSSGGTASATPTSTLALRRRRTSCSTSAPAARATGR